MFFKSQFYIQKHIFGKSFLNSRKYFSKIKNQLKKMFFISIFLFSKMSYPTYKIKTLKPKPSPLVTKNITSEKTLHRLLLPAPPYHLPAPPYSRQIYHLTLFKIFHIPLYPPPSLLLLTASTNRRQKKCSTVCRNRRSICIFFTSYGFYKP